MTKSASKSFREGNLLSSHVEQWRTVWDSGRVDMDGDFQSTQLFYSASYYLFSSLPFNANAVSSPFVGLTEATLGRGYSLDASNVGWFQEMCMFPGIMLLHPELGKVITISRTRSRAMESAKRFAKDKGMEGLLFPSKTTYTGYKTGPEDDYHVTGGTSFMMGNYWQLTGDKEPFVNDNGLDLVEGVAALWASAVTHNNTTGVYHINNVKGPERSAYAVDDHTYTNSLAAINLRLANSLRQILGKPENKTWTDIANKLYIPYDEERDFHPMYAGYIPTRRNSFPYLETPDTLMLIYPLMVTMKSSTRENDISIYKRRHQREFSLGFGWNVITDNKNEKADISRISAFSFGVFKIWNALDGNGGTRGHQPTMGTYLQAVLNGVVGCRVHDDHLSFNPRLTRKSKEIKVTGLDYQGHSFNVRYNNDNLWVTLTSTNEGGTGLETKMSNSDSWNPLTVGIPFQSSRQAFEIRLAQ